MLMSKRHSHTVKEKEKDKFRAQKENKLAKGTNTLIKIAKDKLTPRRKCMSKGHSHSLKYRRDKLKHKGKEIKRPTHTLLSKVKK